MAKAPIYPIVRDFNFTIGPNVLPGDAEMVFGSKEGKVFGPVIHLDRADINDLLVQAGCFPSKGEARKNYQGGKPEIRGYGELGPVGKGKTMIYIWAPEATSAEE